MGRKRFTWMKTFVGGKHLGEENIWGRKTFGEEKIYLDRRPPREAENIWGRKDLIG